MTVAEVVNAAVVRRGRSCFFELEGSEITSTDLQGLAVFGPARPGEERPEITHWTSHIEDELLCLEVPADAMVGDYEIQLAEERCTLYIVFDPYRHLASGKLSTEGFATWAYSDDPYPYTLSDYVNYVFYGPGPSGVWDPDTAERVYGFKGGEDGRDEGVFGQRLVELAVSIHGWGAQNPEQAGIHLYELVGQRLTWTSSGSFSGLSNGYYNTFDRVFNGEGVYASDELYTAEAMSVDVAEACALGRGRFDQLPTEYIIDFGQCMNFATLTAALARSIGIPGRACYTIKTTGWPISFHVWAELHIPDASWTPPGWSVDWWKFDSADELDNDYVHAESSIAPPRMDGWADFNSSVLNQPDCGMQGGQYRGAYDANLTRCSEKANHSTTILRPGATRYAAPEGTMIWFYASAETCPWAILDTWTTHEGSGPNPRSWVYTEPGGYALNSEMNLADGGAPVIENSETEDDLPELKPGTEAFGILGGLGANYYWIDLDNIGTITIELTQGASPAVGFGLGLYASIDTVPYITDGTEPTGQYRSLDGSLTVSAIPANSERLYVMVVGWESEAERFGNQVWTEFGIRAMTSDVPLFTHLNPAPGQAVTALMPMQFTATHASGLDRLEVYLDDLLIAWEEGQAVASLSLDRIYNFGNETPWGRHQIKLIAIAGDDRSERNYPVTLLPDGLLFYEDFEFAADERWRTEKDAEETTGLWVTGTPYEARAIAPGNPVTQPDEPSQGINCLFTGQNDNGSAATEDVDQGAVRATSQPIYLPGAGEFQLSYDLWWYNRDLGEDAEDYFRCEISLNGGADWTVIDEVDNQTASLDWQTRSINLSDSVTGVGYLLIRFTASDGATTGNLIEAGVDNISLSYQADLSETSVDDSWKKYQ